MQYLRSKIRFDILAVDGIEHGATRERMIHDICVKFSVDGEQAEKLYDRFAPATV